MITTLLFMTGESYSQSWNTPTLNSNYPKSINTWSDMGAVGIGRPVGSEILIQFPPPPTGVYGDYYYNSHEYPALLVHSMLEDGIDTEPIIRLQGVDDLTPTEFVPSYIQFWSGEYRKNGEWQVSQISSISGQQTSLDPLDKVAGGLVLHSRSNLVSIPFNPNQASPPANLTQPLHETFSVFDTKAGVNTTRPQEQFDINLPSSNPFNLNRVQFKLIQEGSTARPSPAIKLTTADLDQVTNQANVWAMEAERTSSTFLGDVILKFRTAVTEDYTSTPADSPIGTEEFRQENINGTNVTLSNYLDILSLRYDENDKTARVKIGEQNYNNGNPNTGDWYRGLLDIEGSHIYNRAIVREKWDNSTIMFEMFKSDNTTDNKSFTHKMELDEIDGNLTFYIGSTDLGAYSGPPIYGTPYPLAMNSANTKVMWFKQNGEVVIGNKRFTGSTITDPLKLSVDGALAAREIIVNTTTWADYVFKSDYELTPILELEEKINSLGHLPGVPSEADVKENGVNINQMQVKMLEKIEELTLYMIQLKKENESLKKEIEIIKEK